MSCTTSKKFIRRRRGACDSCKQRKVRCDGESPCTACQRSGSNCHYQPSLNRSKISILASNDTEKSKGRRLPLLNVNTNFPAYIPNRDYSNFTPDSSSRSALSWNSDISPCFTMSPDVECFQAMSPDIECFQPISPYVESFQVMSPDIESIQSMSPEIDCLQSMSPDTKCFHPISPDIDSADYAGQSTWAYSKNSIKEDNSSQYIDYLNPMPEISGYDIYSSSCSPLQKKLPSFSPSPENVLQDHVLCSNDFMPDMSVIQPQFKAPISSLKPPYSDLQFMNHESLCGYSGLPEFIDDTQNQYWNLKSQPQLSSQLDC